MATEAGRADGNGSGDEGVDEITRRVGRLSMNNFVYFKFSLETTGVEQTPHRIRIAACRQNEAENNRAWHLLPIRPALEEFLNFLGNEPVVLFGPNLNLFHYSRFLTALQACNLDAQFEETVYGFVETLPLFRKMIIGVENYALPTLYTYYTRQVLPGGHGAIEDVHALKMIMDEVNPTSDLLKKYSSTFGQVRAYQLKKQERQESPWTELMNRRVISEHIRNELVMFGPTLDEVRRVFRTEGQGENALRKKLWMESMQSRHIDDIVGYLHDNP